MGRKLTQNEFIKKAQITSPNLSIIGNYINSRSKIKVKCNICSYEWDATATTILGKHKQKYYCPNCNNKKPVSINRIKECLLSNTHNIEILDLEKYNTINKKSVIKFMAMNCKHVFSRSYTDVLQNTNFDCPYCTNQKLLVGFNDTKTLYPWLTEYVINEDKHILEEHIGKANIRIHMKCPYCEHVQYKDINTVISNGFSCNNCSDGVSIPEKYISELLHQFNIKFIKQYHIEGYIYKYDFYLFDYNLIIETHGEQHYKENSLFKLSLKEQQLNDNNKQDIAIQNGYNYLIIDCKYSTNNYLKKSIIQSGLLNILKININNINWDDIFLKANKSKIFEVIKQYNNDIKISDISNNVGLSLSTVKKYLRFGSNSGLCSYLFDIRENKSLTMVNRNKKSIICLNTNEKYDQMKIASKKYGIPMSTLSRHLSGELKHAGYDNNNNPLIWKYA